MKYVEYFRQGICDSGEFCEAVMTLVLFSFAMSVLFTCIGSLA